MHSSGRRSGTFMLSGASAASLHTVLAASSKQPLLSSAIEGGGEGMAAGQPVPPQEGTAFIAAALGVPAGSYKGTEYLRDY